MLAQGVFKQAASNNLYYTRCSAGVKVINHTHRVNEGENPRQNIFSQLKKRILRSHHNRPNLFS